MLFLKSFWIAVLICMIPCSSVRATPLLPDNNMNLTKQDKALIRDLKLINYPPHDWRKDLKRQESERIYDVAIVGAGMAGLAAGAALFKEGIFDIQLFDQSPQGSEGPWVTYARMRTLRSTKEIMGPGLGIPHLTFHAWFEAIFGAEAWKQMGKIPNQLWMDYLNWYRQVLQIPVENHCTLVSIIPMQDYLQLEFQQFNQPLIVKARKAILATGRTGFGGLYIPEDVKQLPKSVYAHTAEPINFEALKDRRVGILGVGASSFDAAAAALEKGAKSVDLIMRRSRLPSVNKFASLPYKGFSLGYHQLSDEKRWEFMCTAMETGSPPPYEALDRVKDYQNLSLRSNTTIFNMQFDGSQIQVETNQGNYYYDFLILGTGFLIDGSQQPELRLFIDQIALWQDRMPLEKLKSHPKLGRFPYLGSSFEFLPKEPGTAPYLKNLYCFNYGATLSHGLLSSDIPAISMGATRLAQGIAADFFMQDSEKYLEYLKNYQEQEFDQEKYFPIKN